MLLLLRLFFEVWCLNLRAWLSLRSDVSLSLNFGCRCWLVDSVCQFFVFTYKIFTISSYTTTFSTTQIVTTYLLCIRVLIRNYQSWLSVIKSSRRGGNWILNNTRNVLCNGLKNWFSSIVQLTLWKLSNDFPLLLNKLFIVRANLTRSSIRLILWPRAWWRLLIPSAWVHRLRVLLQSLSCLITPSRCR